MLALDFKLSVPDDPEARNQALQVMLWAMIAWNQRLIRWHREAGRPLPSLYDSGVRYIREPEGEERWQDILSIIADGGADCEDLTAWRVAELRDRGVNARPAWKHRRVKSTDTGKEYSLYHIVVWTPAGILDPSRKLGMGGPGDVVAGATPTKRISNFVRGLFA